MKINYLKINGFGKFESKEINLENKINIIYGGNETGKSSMLKFISGMFYGMSKNKNGKDIPDFDRFKPWKTEEFSGKMRYTLDNNKTYEIFREFKKKNPIIYNEKMEDISREFKVDKTRGIEFFLEQTGIDEDTFYSTAITEQEGIKLSQSSQNSIVQKISNLISSGDDNVSYKKSIERITRMQNEQVGTDRTFHKPINIIENKIKNLTERKHELEIYKENMYNNSEEKEKLECELDSKEIKREFLREVRKYLDDKRIKNAEINFNRNLEQEYNRKIEELNNKINRENSEDSKANLIPYFVILLISIIIYFVVFIFNYNKTINIVFAIPMLVIMGIIIFKKRKYIINKIKKVEKNEIKIESEIKILEENKKTQKKEAEEKQEKLNRGTERERKELINKYIDILDLKYIEININKNYDEILREIEIKENRINSMKFKLQIMENEDKNINNKLEDLAKIEEELESMKAEKEELVSLNKSFNLARECIENAYVQVKENISPKFTENLCDIISKISDGRYKKVSLDDNEGLCVEIENGKYIPVSRLSIGTIDQMYLSLRLSALDEISKESMPIILDEAFAYFDNERLKNMLRYINKNYQNNQVIILTCSNREKEALQDIKVKYNLISLEK